MSRLPDDLQNRTKAFASACIRLYCTLPKQREEIKVLGRQMLRKRPLGRLVVSAENGV
jgi:hypothetical protein